MLPAEMVLQFFLHKKISHLLLLLCSAREPGLVRQLARSGMAVGTAVLGEGGIFAPNLAPWLAPARTGVLVDTTCAARLLTELEDEGVLWKRGYSWLLLANGSSYSAPRGRLRDVNVAAPDGSGALWVLAAVGHPTRLDRDVATWSPASGLQLLPAARRGTRPLALRMSIPNGGRGRRYNFDQSVLRILAELLDFRLQTETPNTTKDTPCDLELWGLQTLRDVSPATVTVTPHTLRLAHFSIAVDTFRPRLFYWLQSAALQRNVYVLPFSAGVWASLCCVLVTITVALTFILGREGRLERALHAQDKRYQQPPWDLTEVMLVTIGAICQQGCPRDPVTLAARILFIASFLLAVVAYTSYSAGVISIMSSAGPAGSTSHAVLRMRTALHDNLYFHTHFKLENNAVSRHIAKSNKTPSYLELSAGLQHVLQGTAAFCADRAEAHTELHDSGQSQDQLCRVGEVALLRAPEHQRAFPLRSDSPYMDDVNRGLVRMLEHGLVSREKRKWLRGDQPLCSAADSTASSRFNSVTLADFRPTLQLIAWGIMLAVLTLSAELITCYCTSYWKHTVLMKRKPKAFGCNLLSHGDVRLRQRRNAKLQESARITRGNFPFVR